MDQKISVIINTFNEEKNIETALKSVSFADEVIVCDMNSQDNTVEIAKKSGAQVIFYKYTGFVEPARNFAISKVSNPWILILDADERIENELRVRIKEIVAKTKNYDFVKIPRKNIIFGKWVKSGWWPDYQIRLFKKGKVTWGDKIHSQPKTLGKGLSLPTEEKYALIHNNYQSIGQFIERMNRYTTIEADELEKQKVKFEWKYLIEKPLSEFLSRFFANKGYQDGLHGLVLSILQAISFFVVYLKVWENSKFRQEDLTIADFQAEIETGGKGVNYWFRQISGKNSVFSKLLKVFK